MTRRCLFVYLFGIAVYFATVTVASEAIIGGVLVGADQFPYHVSLQLNVGVSECSGSIIDDEYILSAAHCFLDNDNHFHRRLTYIVAGTNDLRRTNAPAVTIPIKKVFVPTEYVLRNDNTTGDIAVLKLNHTLASASYRHLKKIKLPRARNQRDSLYVGEEAIVTGFGAHAFSIVDNREVFYFDPRLRYAEADVINSTECQSRYLHAIYGKHICARIKQHPLLPGHIETPSMRRGICTKDSGAPLVHDGTTVIGVLSRGGPRCSDRLKPGVYTRVSHFLTFIRNAMKNKTTRFIRSYEY